MSRFSRITLQGASVSLSDLDNLRDAFSEISISNETAATTTPQNSSQSTKCASISSCPISFLSNARELSFEDLLPDIQTIEMTLDHNSDDSDYLFDTHDDDDVVFDSDNSDVLLEDVEATTDGMSLLISTVLLKLITGE